MLKSLFCTAVLYGVLALLLLVSQQTGKIAVSPNAAEFPRFDASTLPVTAKVHIGGDPDWLGIGFGSVWVSVPKNNEVVRINPSTNAIETRIKVGEEPCYGIGI